MPFTFSHPAIVLSLKYLPNKWFSLTGLVIGSVTPDFEYFIRMRVQSNYSHTIGGIFWFDLPLGLLLCFIFHNIVKNPLFQNLPNFFQARVLTFTQFNWNHFFRRNWIIVLFSILIGIGSHLLWDSFTHDHGYFVNRISFLKESILLFNHKILVLKLAQHTSTILGGIVILHSFLKLPETITDLFKINRNYWITLALIAFLILILRFAAGLGFKEYGHIIVSIISSIFISSIVAPLLLNFNKTQKS
ncbi:DUF4184 family protein [Flavobacterium sp.]|uniref:DUF4184 family protein n=1 Tax=Flavobacterium sp. TaxID=239 RepID=UPI0031D61DC3